MTGTNSIAKTITFEVTCPDGDKHMVTILQSGGSATVTCDDNSKVRFTFDGDF